MRALPIQPVHFAGDIHTAAEAAPCGTDFGPRPGWHIGVDSRDGVTIFRLTGPIDSSSADSTRQALAKAAGLDRVLLDLSGVTELAPAGIGVLMGAVRRVQEAHGTVVLVAPTGAVSGALMTSGVAHLTHLVETDEEGLRLLTEPPVASASSVDRTGS